MSEVNTTKPPAGTRDFLPGDVKLREEAFASVKRVFESYGFLPMETPAFERLEILMGKYGGEGERLIYKILKRGEKGVIGEADLALRYDLTIPLARVVAEYQHSLPSIFKRYQIGPVWRADRPGKGRFREFYQCDIDTVGVSSIMADAEIILALSQALAALRIDAFEVRLNSRKVLTALLDLYGVPAALRKGTVIAIDKIDRVEIEEIKEDLRAHGLSREMSETLAGDLGDPAAATRVRERLASSAIGRVGLGEVEEILELVTPLIRGKVTFSPFLARGLEYYTGPVFEMYVKGTPLSIASGGRYDNLIGMFSKRSIAACGGSLGIERIFMLLREQQGSSREFPWIQVFVTVWAKEFRQDSLRLAAELRKSGMRCEVFLDEAPIGHQLRMASDKGASYAILFGPDEKSRKEVTMKNLRAREQRSVREEEFVSFLLRSVNNERESSHGHSDGR
ncbi:MAG: histidyl-tRNA synthetase [Parcubacteria group bacterium Gr01-1014_38]|nr:MAG: histidyl-tRNA synthetase [Parcubacteria group bacterium Gr01-1014_38]